MGLFDLFRRRPPIEKLENLADFMDRQAAFLVQKGIYEYSRARAGHYSKVLFREPAFQQAVEGARWRAYPLGLLMVAELVEGVLRPYADDRNQQVEALDALALSVFDRYPVPTAFGQESWREVRAELARRLKLIGLHAPKPAMDIPEPYVQAYFDLMPIHAKLRGSDFPTIRNYLRVTLCNIHEELTKGANGQALAAMLSRRAA